MKILVLENDLAWSQVFEDFLQGMLSKYGAINYNRYNPDIDDSHDAKHTPMWLAMHLAQPELTDVCTSSTFSSKANTQSKEDYDEEPSQLAFLLPVVQEAVWFRDRNNLGPLKFHVMYEGEDFVRDMKEGDFGSSVIIDLEFMLTRFNNVEVMVYSGETAKLKYHLKGNDQANTLQECFVNLA